MSKINCSKYDNKNFNIQNLTRIKEDKCYLTQNDKMISKPGMYSLTNFKDCECRAPNTKSLSLQNPSTFYRDGYGWTSNKGCNIDDDSTFRNSRNLTNLRNINTLYQRPYLTVPYMGRGSGNVCTESNLRSSEDTFQNRPCNNLAGITINRNIPQLDCIKDNIQNPIHLIPEVNDCNWIRGGQPSRQIIRNKEYLEKCGFKYNGKLWIR